MQHHHLTSLVQLQAISSSYCLPLGKGRNVIRGLCKIWARLEKISDHSGVWLGGSAKLHFFHCIPASSDIICQPKKLTFRSISQTWTAELAVKSIWQQDFSQRTVFVTQLGPSQVISLFTLMGNTQMWQFELTHSDVLVIFLD